MVLGTLPLLVLLQVQPRYTFYITIVLRVSPMQICVLFSGLDEFWGQKRNESQITLEGVFEIDTRIQNLHVKVRLDRPSRICLPLYT